MDTLNSTTTPDSIRNDVVRHFSHHEGRQSAIPAEERYSQDELSDMPLTAVQCSDGCGNPLLYTNIQPGDTVVDLGSGAGLDLLLAARRTGSSGKVIGVDMTEGMITLARASIQKAGLANVEVRRGLIEELPIESESVDWVISNCVINLSPEKQKVFAEILRVLRPGGKMVISDTVVSGVPSWLRRTAAIFNKSVNTLLDETNYLQILQRSGLTQIEIKERTVFTGPRFRRMLAVEAGHSLGAGPTGKISAIHRIYMTPLVYLGGAMLSGRISSIKVFAAKI